MPSKYLSIRLDGDLRERAQAAAAADRRSLTNWVAVTIEQALDAKDKKESA
jgi:predicted HicB family RNase H-like nuclease